jgi:NADH:ubiquinone oxidoreductase subunit 6 (subunit J)
VGPFALVLELLAVLLVVALLGALYFARSES